MPNRKKSFDGPREGGGTACCEGRTLRECASYSERFMGSEQFCCFPLIALTPLASLWLYLYSKSVRQRTDSAAAAFHNGLP